LRLQPGNRSGFLEAARRLGKILASERVGLVYGGGSRGLMGAVATSVLDHGGHVTGIIPEFLQNREQTCGARRRSSSRRTCTCASRPCSTRPTRSWRSRRIGTLEELVEQLTWAQLGRHKKPILILNAKGFWDPLCALLDHMRGMEFIRAELGVALLVAKTAEEVLPTLRKAAADVSEREKRGKPETVERM
jgi:predicted Rossmann-fold nucleotide-binding protein